MSPSDFRTLALDLPYAQESSHMGHPDFRVRGKIFATLWPADRTRPDDLSGMVKLTPAQQRRFIKDYPRAFSPIPGGWGKNGATQVLLGRGGATKPAARQALLEAWRCVAPKKLIEELGPRD